MMERKKDLEELSGDWFGLIFDVRRSVRYHMRRTRFFDHFHSFTNAIGVIAGSGAAVSVLTGHSTLTIWMGLIVAISSAVDLVVGTGQMARLHNDLAKRFIQLEKEMIIENDPPGEERIKEFISRRLGIEEDEPPILRTLDRLCYNELKRSMGYSEKEMIKIPRIQKALAQFV